MKITNLSYPHSELRHKETGESCAISTLEIKDGQIDVGVSSPSGYSAYSGTYNEVLDTLNKLYEEYPFESYIETEKIIDEIVSLTKLLPRHTEKWYNQNCYYLFKNKHSNSTRSYYFGEFLVENLTICIIPSNNTGSHITVRLDCGFDEKIVERKFNVKNIDIKQVADFINTIFDCCLLMFELAQKQKENNYD